MTFSENKAVNWAVGLVLVALALVVVCLILLVVHAYTTKPIGAEHLEAAFTVSPGASFAGVRSDAYANLDTSLGGGVELAAAGACKAEHLVPGYATWPSPTESNPRRVDFAETPCDAAAVYNQNANTNSLSPNGTNAGMQMSRRYASKANASAAAEAVAAASERAAARAEQNGSSNAASLRQAAARDRAIANAVSKEHLSAMWKRENLASGNAGDAREVRIGAEHASDYRVNFDPMRNRMAADSYARENMSGLEDALIGM